MNSIVGSWYVVKGHNGVLVAIQNPSAIAVIVAGPIITKAGALEFIEAREKERQVAVRIWITIVVLLCACAIAQWAGWI